MYANKVAMFDTIDTPFKYILRRAPQGTIAVHCKEALDYIT